jgi:hypothetical protein
MGSISDTDPRAMGVLLDLYRKQSAGEKLRCVLDASSLVMTMQMAGIRSMYPQASEREVFLRMAARHLDHDLMIRAYQWDPDEHE